jgi:hypothetical protein
VDAPAVASTPTCVATNEVCDGRDNDCDGQIDEGFFANAVSDSGFEAQLGSLVERPWRNFKGAAIEGVRPKSGQRNAVVFSEPANSTIAAGWNDIYQTIEVVPNTTYKLQAYVRTSDNTQYGRFGVREVPEAEIGKCSFVTCPELGQGGVGREFNSLPEWTLLATLFTSRASTTVDIYIGLLAGTGGARTTLYVDEVFVQRLSCGQ